MTLSSSPWWCAPVLALGWMVTVPAHSLRAPARAWSMAAARDMPGVCAVFGSSSCEWTMRTPCSRQSVMAGGYRNSFEHASHQARLAQVQIVLDLAQHLVADASLVAEPDGRLPLDLQQLADERGVLAVRLRTVPVRRFVQRLQALAVVLRQVVIEPRPAGIVLGAR